MNLRLHSRFFLATMFVAATWIGGCEKYLPSEDEPQTQPASTVHDEDYIAALHQANRFCDAWLARDESAGRALLTRRFIRQHPDQRLRDGIAGLANPHHAAFELSDGRKTGKDRYVFDVRLFLQYSGMQSDRIEAPLEHIVVVRNDSGQWRIDEFPLP